MKNTFLILRPFTALVIIAIMTLSSLAQTTTVGLVKGGVAQVSDLAAATVVLKGGLSAASIVSNIHIAFEPESGTYFLVGGIANSSITGKAVELQLDNGVLRAIGGPGIEITCVGYKCDQCIPRIFKFGVRCVCESLNPPSDYRCDMTSKLVLTLW